MAAGQQPNSTGSGWRVSGQSPQVGPDERGNYVSGVRVSFLTDSGIEDSVFLSDRNYNPENVKAAIMDRAALHNQIGQLKA